MTTWHVVLICSMCCLLVDCLGFVHLRLLLWDYFNCVLLLFVVILHILLINLLDWVVLLYYLAVLCIKCFDYWCFDLVGSYCWWLVLWMFAFAVDLYLFSISCLLRVCCGLGLFDFYCLLVFCFACGILLLYSVYLFSVYYLVFLLTDLFVVIA